MVVTAALLVRADNVILATFYGLAPEKAVEFVAMGVLVRPLPDGLKHFLLDLDAFVADGWVVKRAENVVDDFVDGDSGMFPSIEYTTGMYALVNTGLMTPFLQMTYGTVYFSTLAATLPAHELRMLVKWSLESIECVGFVHCGSVHGSS